MNDTWKWDSPPFFAQFRRVARELLELGFGGGDDSIFKLSTVTKSGDSIRSTVYFNPESADAYLDAHFNFNNNSSLMAKFNTNSNMINADINLRKRFGESTETGVWLSVPRKTCSRLFVSSLHQHSTITVVADRYPSPNVTLEASLGTKSLAFGGKLIYEPLSNNNSLRPLEIGIEASNHSFTATALVDPLNETVLASCVHHIDKDKTLGAGLEICRYLRTNEYWFTAGGAWCIDGPSTVLKATVDERKTLKAYARHHVKDRNLWVEIGWASDINALIDKRPNIFLSLEVVT